MDQDRTSVKDENTTELINDYCEHEAVMPRRGDEDVSKEIESLFQIGNITNTEYLDKLFNLDKENKDLKLKVESLEKHVCLLEADTSKEVHGIQMESADKAIQQLKCEIERLQENARQQAEASLKKIQLLQADFDGKLERLAKQLEQAGKERDAMVMKYAVSENNAIALQRSIKQLESKIKDHIREKESLNLKINVAASEKVKLGLIIDGKNTEILGLERDIQKKKDELHAQSSNLKFFQNKLKIESESHKDTQNKLERAYLKLKEAKEETEQVRRDGQTILRKYETDGRRVLEMQDAAEVTSLQEQLEVSKLKNNELTHENNKLCKMVQSLETERLDCDVTLSQFKQSDAQYRQMLLDLQATKSELESTKILFTREQEKQSNAQVEMDRLRQTNSDIEIEMSQCRDREAELLSFTQMLTEKNVSMQSEISCIESRLQQQQVDTALIKGELRSLKAENVSLISQLEIERQQRRDEKEMLTRHLQEKTETSGRLSQQLQDHIGEMQLMKKKHLASVKELSRELQSLRKKEAIDMVSLSQGSHSSSSTSLNVLEVNESQIPPLTQHLSASAEPNRQLLIEKLVKVQRSNAHKQEKIEFLEEHVGHLVVELQKKSKIIQSLVMKHQPSDLVTMDENKIALLKHSCIMASVYNAKPTDDSITLQLSLEINRKLQAVLEDTLFKNITLKENLETLGNEIARLAALETSRRK